LARRSLREGGFLETHFRPFDARFAKNADAVSRRKIKEKSPEMLQLSDVAV
jgi:hypothetical protein